MKKTSLKKTIFLPALALLLAIAACTPDPGPGGKGTIQGFTRHHDEDIPGTKVYIKYGTTDSPGTDPAVYDDSTTADGSAFFQFNELEKGTYYVFGIGFDSAINQVVRAGVPVVLDKKETQDILLPVTE